MDDLMLALFLICLGFLIIGLIKPTAFQILFKEFASRKNLSIIFGSFCLVFFILFGILSDGNTNSNIEKHSMTADKIKDSTPTLLKKPIVAKPKIKQRDYTSFNYRLPESNYFYKIKITEIKTRIAKEIFETQVDKYSLPTRFDGYFLSVKFTMTNPYQRDMLASVPTSYYITSVT